MSDSDVEEIKPVKFQTGTIQDNAPCCQTFKRLLVAIVFSIILGVMFLGRNYFLLPHCDGKKTSCTDASFSRNVRSELIVLIADGEPYILNALFVWDKDCPKPTLTTNDITVAYSDIEPRDWLQGVHGCLTIGPSPLYRNIKDK